MGRILITSFEPFGVSGLRRGTNASHDVAMALQSTLPPGLAHGDTATEYRFLQLPVSDKAHDILQTHLDAYKPDGLLCMGEYLGLTPGAINLEPYALDHPVSHDPLAPTDGIPRILSAFAQSVAPQNNASIGLYYCNAIYRQALLWGNAQPQPVPTAFIHVAVRGDRSGQVREIAIILDKLTQHTLAAPKSGARWQP